MKTALASSRLAQHRQVVWHELVRSSTLETFLGPCAVAVYGFAGDSRWREMQVEEPDLQWLPLHLLQSQQCWILGLV